MVERLPVKEMVPGSSPGRGAAKNRQLLWGLFLYPIVDVELFLYSIHSSHIFK
jgi:hypothetical protein